MAKKLGVILLFIALGAGAIAYTASQNTDSTESSTAGQTGTADIQPEAEVASDQQAEPVNTSVSGSYVDYSEEALANAEGQKVLFFHAPWCPQCRSVEAGIEAAGVPDGYTILKVDYDSNQALRAKYGVRLQTTFVKLDDTNNKIDEHVAYNEPTFEAVKRDYIN